MLSIIEPVNKLLEETAIVHDGSLKDIVEKTQQIQPKGWLRAQGKERWEIEESYFGNKIDIFMPLFDQIQYTHELYPTRIHYDFLLFLGTLLDDAQVRFNFLIKLWNQGLRFNTLVFLTGERMLDPKVENLSFLNGQKTEAEMIRFLYDTIDMPKDMRIVPVVFVNAPQKIDIYGNAIRPNTEDTVCCWLKNLDQESIIEMEKYCLALSTQPYVHYQHAVVKTLLPSSFLLESVGSLSSEEDEKNITLLFDSLARNLYQEQKRLSLKKH